MTGLRFWYRKDQEPHRVTASVQRVDNVLGVRRAFPRVAQTKMGCPLSMTDKRLRAIAVLEVELAMTEAHCQETLNYGSDLGESQPAARDGRTA